MERNFKYKVGDRVIASDNVGIYKKRPGTITELWYNSDHPTPYRVDFDGWDGNGLWSEVHSLISPEKKIVVTTDGVKITNAKLYENGKVVKTAEAKCCPEDTFDFNFGAKLAIDRLIGTPVTTGEEKTEETEWKVVKRPVKVGDYIRLTKKSFSFDTVGDILKVDVVKVTGLATVYEKNHPNKPKNNSNFPWNYDSYEYEVVEKVTKETKPVEVDGFKVGDRVNCDGRNGTIIAISAHDNLGVEFDEPVPCGHNCGGVMLKAGKSGKINCCRWLKSSKLTHGEAPTYYNGKVVCVDNKYNTAVYTIGKIYQFVDGFLICDGGYKINSETPCTSFEDWSKWTSSEFIEVVE